MKTEKIENKKTSVEAKEDMHKEWDKKESLISFIFDRCLPFLDSKKLQHS